MKVLEIKKELVLRAIEKEPLRGQGWVHDAGRNNPDCPVCAVGAALRHHGFQNDSIRMYAVRLTQGKYRFEDDYEEALEKKNYLGALSIFFEKNCGSCLIGDLEEKLKRFVIRNFPDRFYLLHYEDYNGLPRYRTYIPAEGESIVEESL